MSLAALKASALSAFGDAAKKSADKQTDSEDGSVERTKQDLKLLPVPSPTPIVADFAFLKASCSLKYPRQPWMKTDFNVNAKHGGGTALLFISRRYEIDKHSGNHDSEVQLIRCGFDGNNFEGTSLALSSKHTIYHYHTLQTDETGNICPAAMFGYGESLVVSNIASMGNCSAAVIFESPSESTEKLSLGAPFYGLTRGCFLVICSVSGDQETGNVYFVYYNANPDNIVVKALLPDKSDLWKIELTGTEEDSPAESQELFISGPKCSHYSALQTYSGEFVERYKDNPKGKVYHTQVFDGSSGVTLLTGCSRRIGYSLLLMCSSSSGPDDATTSALYQVTIQKSDIDVSYIGGSTGTYDTPSAWTITLSNDELVVTGPPEPCRYGFISNMVEYVENPDERCNQGSCLATGKDVALRSGVEVRDNSTIVGWVSESAPIKIWINSKVVEHVEEHQLLEQPDGRLGFQRELTEEEKSPGMKLIRVYAIQKDINNKTAAVELTGSPLRLAMQPNGVMYAVNLGGPVYESSNNIVFDDTQSLFTYNKTDGYECLRRCSNAISRKQNLYSIMANTNDGFLHGTYYCTNHDNQELRDLDFQVPLPRGDYLLTLYANYIGMNKVDVYVDGKLFPFTSDETEWRELIPSKTAAVMTVPFTVDGDGTSTINLKGGSGPIYLCGLLVTDVNKYVIHEKNKEEKVREAQEKQQVSDKLVPMERSFLKKEMKIAGWSANLLQNASGEKGDTSCWDVEGTWKVDQFGGDQTESRFISSHMTCVKSQDVDLTKHFNEEYLDTSPEIQASESYKEGCNHFGFYSLTVTLLTSDGETLEEKTTNEKAITLEQRDWFKEGFVFKGYGKGLRRIKFTTTAHDQQFWAGHFGAMVSAALLRVKMELIPAENDEFADVVESKLSKTGLQDLSKVIQGLHEQHKNELEAIQLKIASNTEGDQEAETKRQESSTHVTTTRKSRRPKKREIRVFVSSTFVDFKDEREILIKKVFRELNRLCLDRGVFFSYVDLRWGITSEQSKDGKTIFICLSEVDRCRPYFICLLGDRFGWNQRIGNEDRLLDATYDYALQNLKGFEWLNEYRYDTSVTKLEILHAALRDANSNQDRTFFYLRESRVKREDLPRPGDMVRGENTWHYDQQQELRTQVREKGKTTRDFKTAEDGCAKIKQDLMRCINEDFPPGSQLTHVEREREAHQAFADVRRRVYIGREEYFEAIDKHFEKTAAKGDNEPLVILGTSGCGKSALVANWCGRFEEKNPDDFMFMHFIGSSAESASHLNLLRRLYEELREYLQQDLAIPSSEKSLILELPSWLKLASNRGNRIMLVFDALNQLDSGVGQSGEEQELKWLPEELPDNVYLLMSTLPGKAKQAVEAAGWPTMQVYPLNPAEKMEIITTYMSLFSKTLNEEQLATIVDVEQTNNPLYLKALLDEVRMFGSYEQLTDAIKEYVKAHDPGELFVKILERLERDFESGSEAKVGLVRNTTVAIWCSHRGMSEQELLSYLKVQSHIWSPFYLSLEENLVNRNGLVNFFHDYMRQAVERKYLSTKEDKLKGFVALADFFGGQDIDDRYVHEMPYLLAEAGEMKRLKATVLNIAVFRRLMNTDEGKYQLIKAWQLLGGYDNVEEEYLGVLLGSDWKTVGDKAHLMKTMAGFFNQLGLLKGAKLLLDSLLKELEEQLTETHGVIVYHFGNNSYRLRCNHPDVIDVLIELGVVCYKLDMLQEAWDNYEEAFSRQPKPKTPAEKMRYVKTFIGMGAVERQQGNADEAKRCLIRALEISTQLLGSNHHYVAAIIGQIGELSYSQGVLKDAIHHHLWDLKLTQNEVGTNHPRVAAILNNVALVLDDQNNDTAGQLFQAVLAILVEAYGKEHLDVAIVRFNLGTFFLSTNHYKRAEFQLTEALRIFTGFLGEDHPHTQSAVSAQEKVRELQG